MQTSVNGVLKKMVDDSKTRKGRYIIYSLPLLVLMCPI